MILRFERTQTGLFVIKLASGRGGQFNGASQLWLMKLMDEPKWVT